MLGSGKGDGVWWIRQKEAAIKQETVRINSEIRVPQVRLIGADGQQIGVVTIQEALENAEQAGLDLVEIAPTSKPPVCKIMDFGKFKYEQSKKEKETKKKQHVVVTKEVRLRPKIEEHDFQFKVRNARKFLESGCRVKVSLFFRGREMVHRDLGFAIMNRFMEDTIEVAKIEREPKLEGNQIIMFLTKK